MLNFPFKQTSNPAAGTTKFFDILNLKKSTPFDDREREQSIVQLGQAVPLVFGVYRQTNASPGDPGKPVKEPGGGGVWAAPILFKAGHNKNNIESSRLGYIISEGNIKNIRTDDVYFGERRLLACKSLLDTKWAYDYERLPNIFSDVEIEDGIYIKRVDTKTTDISTNDKRDNAVTETRDVNNPKELDDSKFIVINSLGKNIKYTKFVLKNNNAFASIDGDFTGLNGMRCISDPLPWSASSGEIGYESKLAILNSITNAYRRALKEFNKKWLDGITYDVYYREVSTTDKENKWIFYKTVFIAHSQSITVEITHTKPANYEYMLNPIPVRYTGRDIKNLKYKPTSCYPLHPEDGFDHPLIKYGVYLYNANYDRFSYYYRSQENVNEQNHITELEELSTAYDSGSRFAIVGDVGDANKCYRPFVVDATPADPGFTYSTLTNNVYGSDAQFTWNEETLLLSLTQLDYIDVKPITPLLPDRPGLPGTIFGSTRDRLYRDITIGAVSAVVQNPPKDYLSQLFVFCREGFTVTNRMLGGNGPSDNVADLIYYLLKASDRIDESLIDRPSFVRAAKFTENMGFYFNGALTVTSDLREFINTIVPFFLLNLVINDGKIGLQPVIALDASNNPNMGTVGTNFMVSQLDIIPGSYSKTYLPTEKRLPFNAVMNWRKQSPTQIGSITTTVVSYPNTSIIAPYEQYDMTLFCTSEFHATYIARYMLAYRKFVTHTIKFTAGKKLANKVPGQTFSLGFTQTQGSTGTPKTDNQVEYYILDTLTENIDGTVEVTATHFPMTKNMRSIIVQELIGGVVEVQS